MNCCRNSCVYPAVIAAIVAGVILGVLYALGFVTTGVLFWAYLGIGVLGLFALPVYGATNNRCYCQHRVALLAGAIGTVLAAAVGLIVAFVAGAIAIAVAVGVATFFAVLLLGLLVCLANCVCERG